MIRWIRARAPLISCTSAFATLLLPNFGAAQTGEPAGPGSTGPLGDIVVTARKVAENVRDVPASVTALSAEDLRVRPIVTADDLRLVTPGLYTVASSRSPTSVRFTVRGQAQADGTLAVDSSTGLYVDDVNVPRDYGTRLGMYDIARVEVAKGPQGTLFGRNTTGGAIGIFTVQPNFNGDSGFLTFKAGSYGTLEGTGAANLVLSPDKAALRVAATLRHTDGYFSGHDGLPLSKIKETGLRAQLLLEPVDNLSIRLGGYYSRSKGASALFVLRQIVPGIQNADISAGLNLGAVTTAAAGPLGQAYYDAAFARQGRYRTDARPEAPDSFEGWGTNLQIRLNVSDAVNFKSTTAFSGFERIGFPDYDGVYMPVGSSIGRTDARFFSQELQMDGRLGDFDYVTGVFYSRETGTEYSENQNIPNVIELSPTGRGNVITDADLTNRALGIYAQGNLRLFDRLVLTGGVRYGKDWRGLVSRNRAERVSSALPVLCQVPRSFSPANGPCYADPDTISFDGISYTGSAKFEIADKINVYATTRRGFKTGGWNDRTNSTNGFIIFRPEIATDYEVGFKSDLFDNRLRFNVAAFYTDYKDIQRQSLTFPATGNSIRVLRNAASASIKGFEVEVSAAPVEGFRIDGTLSYTNAKYKDYRVFNAQGVLIEDHTKDKFPIPAWTASLGASYQWNLPRGNFRVRADYYRQSSAYLDYDVALGDSTFIQPAYGLLGARIEYNDDVAGFSAAVVGRNLADTYYMTGAQNLRALGFAVTIPGQPRYIGIELTKRFGGE